MRWTGRLARAARKERGQALSFVGQRGKTRDLSPFPYVSPVPGGALHHEAAEGRDRALTSQFSQTARWVQPAKPSIFGVCTTAIVGFRDSAQPSLLSFLYEQRPKPSGRGTHCLYPKTEFMTKTFKPGRSIPVADGFSGKRGASLEPESKAHRRVIAALLPVVWMPSLGGDIGSTTGVGDRLFTAFLSPANPRKWVWGA